jgi:excisionase family DNA binding protein
MLEVELYTVQEVAALARVDARVVYNAVRSGRLPAHKIGREWRITRAAVEAYLLGKVKEEGKR